MKFRSQGTAVSEKPARAREGGAAVSWIPAAPFQPAQAADWLSFAALALFVTFIVVVFA